MEYSSNVIYDVNNDIKLMFVCRHLSLFELKYHSLHVMALLTVSRVVCTICRSRNLELTSNHPTHPLSQICTYFTAKMDVEMGDAAYDIDIDVGAGVQTSAQPQQQVSRARRVKLDSY